MHFILSVLVNQGQYSVSYFFQKGLDLLALCFPVPLTRWRWLYELPKYNAHGACLFRQLPRIDNGRRQHRCLCMNGDHGDAFMKRPQDTLVLAGSFRKYAQDFTAF